MAANKTELETHRLKQSDFATVKVNGRVNIIWAFLKLKQEHFQFIYLFFRR